MKRIFWNANEHRLRSFWRLLLTIFMAVVLSFPTLVVFQVSTPDPLLWLSVTPVIIAIGVLISIGIAARFLDRRPVSDFGLQLDRRWWNDLVFGLLLGAFLIAAVFLVELAAGWVEIVGWFEPDQGKSLGRILFLLALLFICVGIYEEIAYRGYLLRNIAEGLNFSSGGSKKALTMALFFTAGVFGGVHAANPNASLVTVVNTMLPGLVFGLGYLLTGQLGIPIGMHITWNFCQGAVFDFPVSGIDFGGSVVATAQSGPELWTGGAYGPEGGLIGTGAWLLATALMLVWIRFRYGRVDFERSLAKPPPTGLRRRLATPLEKPPG